MMQGYPARGRQQLHVMQSLCIYVWFRLELQGQTALHSATLQGMEDMVVLLLAAGADIDPGLNNSTYTLVSSLLMLALARLL